MISEIVLIYPNEKDTSVSDLAKLYCQLLQQQGYSVLAVCTSDCQSSAELWDTITSKSSPDFGISLNLAGFNFLNTGEDSMLMKLPCPFAHELLMPPYYVNKYLDSRINFNHILYVHNESDAAYIQKYYPDIPTVRTIPEPHWESLPLPLKKPIAPSSIMAEINSLPDVFSMLCKNLINTMQAQPNAIFYQLVLALLKEYGITNMSREEEIEIITMCALASEYVNSTTSITDSKLSPQETLAQFLQNANPICSNISQNRLS